MTARRRRLVAIGAGLYPSTAWAHAPIEGLGTFYSHALAPLLTPEQAVPVVGVALLMGRDGRQAARAGVAAVAAGLVAGTILSTTGAVGALPAWPHLGVGGVAGAALVSDRAVPRAVLLLLSLAAGLAVSLEPQAPSVPAREAALAAAGTISGAVGAVVVLAALALKVRASPAAIALRVLGSWMLAVAVLVLALDLTGSR